MPDGPRHKEGGARVVITGKGGVGKTTLAALLSHLFAQEGKRVLAIDSDPQQNLAATLGIPKSTAEGIVPVSESPAYIREKMGAGPDLTPGGIFILNPDIRDVVGRFSVSAGKNIRLLVMGGVKEAGGGCLCPQYTLLATILRQMQVFDDDVVILDTAAGLEHFGRAIAEGFTSAVVVTDPTYNSVSVARKSAALAHQLGIENVILVINRAEDNNAIHNICGSEGGFAEFTQTVVLPLDPAVRQAEPSVASLADSDSAFVSNVRILLAAIVGRCEKWLPPAR
jgi:CO dehydrogenase maturation factor